MTPLYWLERSQCRHPIPLTARLLMKNCRMVTYTNREDNNDYFKAPSTPATLSKQRSTLSKQHSTLLPQTATMSNDSIVKFRPFDKVETNWTCSICFDIVERIVQLVPFDNVAWTLLLVWTALNGRQTNHRGNDVWNEWVIVNGNRIDSRLHSLASRFWCAQLLLSLVILPSNQFVAVNRVQHWASFSSILF